MRFILPIIVLTLSACAQDKTPEPSSMVADKSSAVAEPIKIGDIMSYTFAPSVTLPSKQGLTLAMEEINASGGVLNRPLEIISRDPQGNPADATRLAIELIERDQVDVLVGTVMDNVKLAVSDVARQYEIPFFCSSSGTERLTIENGHPYVFRTGERFPNLMAALTEAALPYEAKRWVTVAPTMEYGLEMVKELKAALAKLDPEAEIISEQWYPMGKMDAGAVTQTLVKLQPDAIMSGVLGHDMTEFVRQGKQRGLFEETFVMAPYLGVPGWLSVLGAETPEGWLTNGYPADEIDTPKHKAFVKKFEQRYPDEELRVGVIHSYITLHAIAAAIEQAGTTNAQAISKSAHG
ncbi:MAG: ABC transporter substrate-binding protein, partial [Gammaproteobacteria bacterium]|nr:ABC transporter substrate-binding protein [Gammaproteobacteria bacterium]